MNKFNPTESYKSYSNYRKGMRDAKGHFVKKLTYNEYVNAYSELYVKATPTTRHNMPITLAGKRRALTT